MFFALNNRVHILKIAFLGNCAGLAKPITLRIRLRCPVLCCFMRPFSLIISEIKFLLKKKKMLRTVEYKLCAHDDTCRNNRFIFLGMFPCHCGDLMQWAPLHPKLPVDLHLNPS